MHQNQKMSGRKGMMIMSRRNLSHNFCLKRAQQMMAATYLYKCNIYRQGSSNFRMALFNVVLFEITSVFSQE